MPIYAINLNESKEETIRVLQLLFAHGYVFEARDRIRDVNIFLEKYNLKYKTKFCDWYWLLLNKDPECKMVVSAYSCMPSYAVEITVEDFLKLQHPCATPEF